MTISPEVICLLMAVAFMAGTIDAIAGGGGLLTIPALLAAGVPPVSAIATNKLQSSFGTGSAVIAFARAGRIDFRLFAIPALAAFVGSALGAFLLTRIDPAFLSALIPFLLIGMAAYYTFAPKMSDTDRADRPHAALMIVIALVLGAYDGFFGPGTGSFFTTALVAVFGLGITQAVAHTKLLNLSSNLAGLAVLIIGGHVLWIVGLSMAVASIAGAQLGARLALRFGASAVRPLLITVCLALTFKLMLEPDNPVRAAIQHWLSNR